MSSPRKDATRSPTPASQLAAHADQLIDATRIAWRWHGDQTRKGRVTSYMSHLTAVQGLTIQAGGALDEVVAALLHDGLEDAPDPAARAAREQEIDARFGAAVLRIVLDCTDTTPAEAGAHKGPWRERKERYLAQLRGAAAPSLLVAACDKRHNLGDLVSDLRREGPSTLDRFNAGASEQIWYFEGISRIVRPAIPDWLGYEIEALLADFQRLVE